MYGYVTCSADRLIGRLTSAEAKSLRARRSGTRLAATFPREVETARADLFGASLCSIACALSSRFAVSFSLVLFLSQSRSHSPSVKFTSAFLIPPQLLSTLSRTIHRHMPDLFLSSLYSVPERSIRCEVLRGPARFRLRALYDALSRRFSRPSCCP